MVAVQIKWTAGDLAEVGNRLGQVADRRVELGNRLG